MTKLLSLIVLSGLAGSALAAGNGDIIITDQLSDEIKLIGAGGGGMSTLLAFGPSNDVRLADVKWGPNGGLFVTDGPFPIPNPSHGRLYRVNNPLGAASAAIVSQSDPLQNPIGMAYHAPSNNFLVVNNPGAPSVSQPRKDGLIAVNATTGVQTESFIQPSTLGLGYRAGTYIVRDTLDATGNSFIVGAVNGGSFQSNIPDASGSTIWRATLDPVTLLSTMTQVVDLSTVTGGPFSFLGGITHIPGTNEYYFAERKADAIFKMTLDNAGNFQTLSIIAQGGLINEPEAIAYNPYTGKIVFGVRNEYDQLGGGAPFLAQINADGTGFEVLQAGVHARGIEFVPTPGSLGLLGAMGLLASRRRRA